MRRKLGIIGNTTKPEVTKFIPGLVKWLSDRSISFVIADDLAVLSRVSNCKTLPPASIAGNCEFVLSFGGDGTFLRTAQLIAPLEIPIIGVNLGRFGYLAEVVIEQLYARIEDLLAGEYRVQTRSMLEVSTGSPDDRAVYYGLNDIVIDKGYFPRIVRLETSIDGSYLNTFHADGLIVSTPAGSTGYSLSVGGPIIEPDVEVMIISPVNPHMLANRPLVVDGNRKIEIITFSELGELQLIVDGQVAQKLESSSKVTIQKADFYTKVVLFEGYSFYALLRNKLHWRDQFDPESCAIGDSE